MIKKATKITICILLIATMLAPLVSCATSQTSVTTAAPATTVSPVTQTPGQTVAQVTEAAVSTAAPNTVLHDIPEDVRFDDTTITFAYVEGHSGKFTERSIKLSTDINDGDTVDSLVFQRNERVKERLGVTIETIRMSEDGISLADVVLPALRAETQEYDVLAGYQYFDIGIAAFNLVYDLNKLENNYIDVSKPYWAGNYIDGITYNNRLYWVTGDLALRYIGGMYGSFINSRIYDKYIKPQYGDAYELARSGNGNVGGWTLDKLMEMGQIAYADTGTISDKPDEKDRLGFVIEMADACDGIAFGCDIQFSDVDPTTGRYVCIMNDKNARAIELAEKLDKLFTSNYCLVPEAEDNENQMRIFAGGDVFCTVNKIYQCEVFLRDMEDDFYILPAPKLNDNQLNYTTGIHDGCTLFGITYCTEKAVAASATLELMAAESYKTVAPAYYDEALKFKYTRGQDGSAAEMIDLIRSNVKVDFAAAWSNRIDSIVHVFRNQSALGKFASQITIKSKAYDKGIEKLMVALNKE